MLSAPERRRKLFCLSQTHQNADFPCDLFIAFKHLLSKNNLSPPLPAGRLPRVCLFRLYEHVRESAPIQVSKHQPVKMCRPARVLGLSESQFCVSRVTVANGVSSCSRTKRGSHRLGSAGVRGPSVASQVPGSGASGPLGLAQPQPDVN